MTKNAQGPFPVRGIFTTPNTGVQQLVVVETAVARPSAVLDPATPEGATHTGWAGSIATRLQGSPRRRPSSEALAERMATKPGYSVVYPSRGLRTALAFTEIQPHTPALRHGPTSYILRQAGVTWSEGRAWSDQEKLPEVYLEAIGAAVYCNTYQLPPDAPVLVMGYPRDSRTKERFFGQCAGFEPTARSSTWGHRGARLQSTCGEVAVRLTEYFPFLMDNAITQDSEA